MEIFLSLVNGILILINGVGTFWTILGLPAGILLLVLKSNKKLTLEKKTIFLWMFGRIGLVIASFILIFVVNVIFGFFGIHSNMTLPSLPQQHSYH